LKQRTMLSSWNDVIAYCRTSMVSKDNIVFTFSAENPNAPVSIVHSVQSKLFTCGGLLPR
jgi:hypothetical protein